jgi:hypothetical protein
LGFERRKTMRVCAGGRHAKHEEIVYEGGDCPLCSVIEELEDARGEIADLKFRVKELERLVS